MGKRKANYGIDAPMVIGTLFFLAFVSLGSALYFYRMADSLLFWFLFIDAFLTGISLFAAGCWMVYGIKIAKPKIIGQMVQNLKLAGDEKVLDLGCGRGILLCEVAKNLPRGEVVGIDLWSAQDQSGNSPKKTLENADLEGVKERISVHTGDIRALPFPDNTFDVALSSLCLHNIEDRAGREQALREMVRILKPGGKFAIADIRRAKEYQEFLSLQGIKVYSSGPLYSYCPPITILEGCKLS